MNKQRTYILILVIVLILVATSGYIYFKKPKITLPLSLTLPFQSMRGTSAPDQKSAQDDNKKLVAEIGKLIKLPEGEDPIIGVVVDVNKLSDQPFFKNGKNGDKILFYTVSKKVILYDPVAKQIVDVAPIVISSSSAQPVIMAKIALRNGTPSTGLAARLEADIRKSFPDANIVSRDNASQDNYDKTIVVSLNDAANEAASKLSKTLNASLSNLPVGEAKPSGVDIIVIIGKDKL